LLLFTASIPRGIFCECSEAKVTENPRIVARNYAEMHNFCASRSVLLFTAYRTVNSNGWFFKGFTKKRPSYNGVLAANILNILAFTGSGKLQSAAFPFPDKH